MLYDNRWDDTKTKFISFLKSKPAAERYVYHSFRYCACGQYCRQTRRLLDWVWGYRARREHEREIWWRYDRLAATAPHTFGALLERVTYAIDPKGGEDFGGHD